MHEHVAYMFFFVAALSLALAVMPSDPMNTSYIPSNFKCGQPMHPLRPCTFVAIAIDVECANFYSPSHKIRLDSDLSAVLTLSNYTMAISHLACTQLNERAAAEDVAVHFESLDSENDHFFYDTCCTTFLDATASESFFDTKGEQTAPLDRFATLMMVGALLYLVSSISSSIAIIRWNVAPIPQVTLNQRDQNACCYGLGVRLSFC